MTSSRREKSRTLRTGGSSSRRWTARRARDSRRWGNFVRWTGDAFGAALARRLLVARWSHVVVIYPEQPFLRSRAKKQNKTFCMFLAVGWSLSDHRSAIVLFVVAIYCGAIFWAGRYLFVAVETNTAVLLQFTLSIWTVIVRHGKMSIGKLAEVSRETWVQNEAFKACALCDWRISHCA